MKSIDGEITGLRQFLGERGNSPNVIRMYGQRVKTFLSGNPDAMCLGEPELRCLVDGYIEGLPLTSGTEVAAAAVRYYWAYRFGKPYFARYRQGDFPVNRSIEDEVAEFCGYLSDSGRLSEVSVRDRAQAVRRFLYLTFGEHAYDRPEMTAGAVTGYVIGTLKDKSRRCKGSFGTAIRSYVSFLAAGGFEGDALAVLELPLGTYARGSGGLPECIAEDDYRALVGSIDDASERGARDLAMVLCMGGLGLRAGDVARLELEDVSWRDGAVTVRHSKSKTPRRIPLDPYTGKALEAYVARHRPRGTSRRVFLCTGGEAAGPGMTSAQVGRAVLLDAQKAGIKGYHGTHTLRRRAATAMVKGGAGIKTVADLLGHEQVRTTLRYLRLDTDTLRKAAGEWPKEACDG